MKKSIAIIIALGFVAIVFFTKFVYDKTVEWMNDQFPPALNGILIVTRDADLTKDWNLNSPIKDTCHVNNQEEVKYGEKQWILGVLQFHVSSVDGQCTGWGRYDLFKRKE